MALRHNLLLQKQQQTDNSVVRTNIIVSMDFFMLMILPQVHLRKPCYDFSFL